MGTIDEMGRLVETLAYERALLVRLEALSDAVEPARTPDGADEPLVAAALWIAELLDADPTDVWLALGCVPAAVPPDPGPLAGDT